MKQVLHMHTLKAVSYTQLVTIKAKITVGKDSAETTKDVEVKNYVLKSVAPVSYTHLDVYKRQGPARTAA